MEFSRNLRQTPRVYKIDILFSFFFLLFFFCGVASRIYSQLPANHQEKIQYKSHAYNHKHARVGRSAIKALNAGVGLRYDTDHRYERINKTSTRHIFESIYLFKDVLYDTAAGKVVHLVSADRPTRFLTMQLANFGAARLRYYFRFSPMINFNNARLYYSSLDKFYGAEPTDE